MTENARMTSDAARPYRCLARGNARAFVLQRFNIANAPGLPATTVTQDVCDGNRHLDDYSVEQRDRDT